MIRTRLYGVIHFKTVQTAWILRLFGYIAYCVSGVVLSTKYPSVARTASQSQLWNSAKPRFRHLLMYRSWSHGRKRSAADRTSNRPSLYVAFTARYRDDIRDKPGTCVTALLVRSRSCALRRQMRLNSISS